MTEPRNSKNKNNNFKNLTDKLIRKAKLQWPETSGVGEDMEQMEPSYMAGTSGLDFNNLKLALMIPMNKWKPTFWSSNYTCRYMPKEIYNKGHAQKSSKQQSSE